MLSIEEALNQSNTRLNQAGIDTARLDARLLLEHALGLGDHEASLAKTRILRAEEQRKLEALVERRRRREPLAYILAEREFWSLPFSVTPATLVPRPDSETIIEAALASIPDRHAPLSIVDLGTGSGCLLLSLLHELPNAFGIGIDRSIDALQVARQNAERLSLLNRSSFFCMDWGSGLSNRFDVIMCNPPYIRDSELATLMPEVSEFEPRRALSGGEDGLESYRLLSPHISGMLKQNGKIFFEIGMNQAEDVTKILTANGLQVIDIKRDLGGLSRCIVAELSRSKRNRCQKN